MRGPASSVHRTSLPCVGRREGSAQVLHVRDDFSADYPVSEAELDVIEAFLMEAIEDLLGLRDTSDSKQPQSSANDNVPDS